jgi:hypothetical protein
MNKRRTQTLTLSRFVVGATVEFDASLAIACRSMLPRPHIAEQNPATFRFWISSLPSVMR